MYLMNKLSILLFLATSLAVNAFSSPATGMARASLGGRAFRTMPTVSALHMSEESSVKEAEADPMDEAMEEMDEASRIALEKSRRADELRAQEVFMKKSTGKHKCTNCDWEYDEKKGDTMMIGGMIKPGTPFSELPDNYRCPVCRASKDAFAEVVEEIPGFEVNQGYGFGTNAWSSGQKNLAIFGGLGLFFLLFLSGYAMS